MKQQAQTSFHLMFATNNLEKGLKCSKWVSSDNLKRPKVEGVSKETRDEAPQQVIEKGKEENTEKMPSEDAKTRIQNVKVSKF